MASAELFESYRSLLFTIVYQLTGSASEAEDIVQDTYVRYYEAQSHTAIRSIKAYLVTIATRLALDYAKSARHTREAYIGDWLPEPVLTGADAFLPSAIAEQHEAISFALLVLLETLTPPERAVFLLREVFAFPYEDIAPIVQSSTVACRQIFHRAQQHLARRKPRFAVADATQQAMVMQFLQASQLGQLDSLTQTLAEDVTLWGDGGGKVPTILHPVHGSSTVARYFIGLARKVPANIRMALQEVNCAPAALFWEHDILTTVAIFTITDDRIRGVYVQRNPEKLAFLERQLSRTS